MRACVCVCLCESQDEICAVLQPNKHIEWRLCDPAWIWPGSEIENWAELFSRPYRGLAQSQGGLRLVRRGGGEEEEGEAARGCKLMPCVYVHIVCIAVHFIRHHKSKHWAEFYLAVPAVLCLRQREGE